MAISNNFLPVFNITNELSRDLRNIEIAKQLTTGWYKGKFDNFLRKSGHVVIINGEEYYAPVGMLFLQRDFFNEGTAGWNVAEWLRLIGMQDSDLIEIQITANTDSVDGIYHGWKAKEGISSAQFKHNMTNMKELLINVDEVRIDYENQRYKTSVYNTGALRPYISKELVYGNSLPWATGQSVDSSMWTSDGRILTLPDIQTKPIESGFGKAIRFYKAGIDVTSSYNDTIKNAVQSMIMYSGNDFMQRTASTKISEISYNVLSTVYGSTDSANYISVIGTETFDATIKQSFIDDIDDKHFIRYTVLATTLNTSHTSTIMYSESPTVLDGRSSLTIIRTGTYNQINKVTLSNNFWTLVGYVKTLNTYIQIQSTVNAGDEFLFYDSGNIDIGAYMKVSEFKKLSIDDIGYYIGEYFDIRVTQDDGGWFSGFIGAIAGFLGIIHNFVFDILYRIPVVRIQMQINTKIVNEIFRSDLSDKELYDIANQIVVSALGIVFSWVSVGLSLLMATAVNLAIAGGEAIDKEKEAEQTAEEEKTRKKKLEEDNKKKAEEEEMKKRLRTESELNEQEEFQMFLKNPLYKLEREKNKLESDFRSQFKLL